MKIAGLTMTDIWMHRVLRQRGVETFQVNDAGADITVLVESMQLAHHGPEQNYRPYLHINGELRGVRPHEQLPYGVDEVTFPAGHGEVIDAYYEFDDTQLSRLTQLGYFSTEFHVPEQVTGIEWELPAQIDALVLGPDNGQALTPGSEQAPDVPVVFTQVHDRGDLRISLATSGYDLTDYFTDVSAERPRRELSFHEAEMRSRSDQLNPLFDESEFDHELLDVAVAEPQTQEQPSATTLDQMLAAVAADLEKADELHRQELASQAGTLENIYHSRVAAVLQAESESKPTLIAEEVTPIMPTDLAVEPDMFALDEEDELGVEPMNLGTPDVSTTDAARVEALTRQVSSHAADLEPTDEYGVDHQY